MAVISEFKYAVRLLLKKPGFTVLTILIMAAGIGLSVYLFSYAHSMLHKDLPFRDADTLIKLHSSQNGVKSQGLLDLHDYYEIRKNLEGISEFGAYREISVNVSERDGARRYNATVVEPNFFHLTRTKPIIGREFTDAENRKGSENVVIIGYDLWQNQFGGDRDIIERILRINGESYRIIGVMPQEYFFPAKSEMWMPMRQDATRLARGAAEEFYGVAHLEDGVSIEDINNQLHVIMQRIEEKYPETNSGISAYATTFPMSYAGNSGPVIYTMNIVAILLLILASVNVGNLLLSRAIERRKETAIRVALGAPRARVISQMLWESTIICCMGGMVGLLVVAWGLEITEINKAAYSADKPVFWWKFGIDGFTIKLFIAMVLSTILITGLLPAWRNSGKDFNSALRDGTRGALGRKAGRLNRILAISEIFLSLTVMIATGLIVVGNFMATHADYGADIGANVLTARILLSESNYSSAENQVRFVKTLQSRLGSSPDFGDVMISSALPSEYTWTPAVALEGEEYTIGRKGNYPRVNYIAVTPGSLDKLGVELKDGRYFSSVDDGPDKSSIIVTDSFATRHFSNEPLIGKRIRLAELDSNGSDWMTVVGVVEHTIQGHASGERGKMPSIFRPFSQSPRNEMTIAMQMKSETPAAIRAFRRILASIDPEIPAFTVETYAQKINRMHAPLRFMGTICLLFGVAAIVLAASGIYGVMSNSIGQRTQEIGVKRALGAWEQRITKEFLLAGFMQLLWGGVPGLLAGCAMGFTLSKIFGTGSAALPIVAISMMAIIGSVVLFATYFPTKRALQMEPIEALHYE